MKVKNKEIDGNMVAILEGSLDTSVAVETEKAIFSSSCLDRYA